MWTLSVTVERKLCFKIPLACVAGGIVALAKPPATQAKIPPVGRAFTNKSFVFATYYCGR